MHLLGAGFWSPSEGERDDYGGLANVDLDAVMQGMGGAPVALLRNNSISPDGEWGIA